VCVCVCVREKKEHAGAERSKMMQQDPNLKSELEISSSGQWETAHDPSTEIKVCLSLSHCLGYCDDKCFQCVYACAYTIDTVKCQYWYNRQTSESTWDDPFGSEGFVIFISFVARHVLRHLVVTDDTSMIAIHLNAR